jgi:hypothetical protein
VRSIQQRAQFRLVKLGHHSFLTLESFTGGLIVPLRQPAGPARSVRVGGASRTTGLFGAARP